MNLKINVEPPWTAEELKYLPPSSTPKFKVTGVDASTGQIETYHNVVFDWAGINEDVQSWSLSGHTIGHSLKSIDSIEKVCSGKSIDLRLPSGIKTIHDNVELMSELIKNKGESISITWKKPSRVDHTIFVDIEHVDPSKPPKLIDSYTEKEISLRSVFKVLSLENKNTRELAP